jgi:diguanylate cyclase (GGDEF)-like protein/PAS domain S-box-containing protein
MQILEGPISGLASELESIRRQIVEVQSLVIKDKSAAAKEIPPVSSATPVLPEEREISLPSLLENVPFGMALINSEFRFIRVSRVLCRMLGYLEQELLGLTLAEVIVKEEVGDCVHLCNEVTSGKLRYARSDRRLFNRNRQILWVQLTVSPAQEKPTADAIVLAIFENITERKWEEETLQASIELYDELFENAQEIVYTHDLAGNITSLNKAAERISGFSNADVIGSNFIDWVAPEARTLARQMIEDQLAGKGRSVYELDVISKAGQRVSMEISSHPLFREGKPTGIQGIARNITARKKVEEELSRKNQKLEEWVGELEKRTQEMTLLGEMGDMLRACMTNDEAYSVIVNVAQQIFPVQVGALYIIDRLRNALESVAVWGQPALAVDAFAPDECWALRRGRVHWVEDRNSGPVCKHVRASASEGYLCVPMMAQSQAIGVLYLAQPPNQRFPETKKQLAQAMAEHIAMALSNLKLHETLRSQSIRDHLTGLFNQNFMEESLELELRRSARNQRPLGVVMIEVDNLNLMRTSAGQDSVDSVIRDLGKILQVNIRKEDIVCRLGDGKFVIILPQSDSGVSAQRAENLISVIRGFDATIYAVSVGCVTASIGIATYPDQGRTVEALLRAAESAVRRARDVGGNSIVAAK